MAQDIQEVGRARVWDAYLQLVQLLTSSELVELPANTTYRHCSSAVLLRGTIATSGSHCFVVQKTPAGTPHSPHFPLNHPALLLQCAVLLL